MVTDERAVILSLTVTVTASADADVDVVVKTVGCDFSGCDGDGNVER